MDETVLITGGSGLLALNWALAIRDVHSVTLGLHERSVSLAGVHARRIDLESIDQLAHVFDAERCKLVVHTAGFTNVDECETKPDQAWHVNVKLAANVAKACAKVAVPLIHISTDHLFSGAIPLVGENHHVAPANVYGRTKAEAELQVLDAHPQALVLRTNFYGWGTSYRRSFSDVIIEALRSGKNLTLFKDIFYTPILIEALAKIAHELIDLKARGIFHVVGDERISKYEFGIKVAEEFNLDASPIKPGFLAEQNALVPRPHDMSLSNEKASKFLGRKLGGIVEHIARLRHQEQSGLAREIQTL